MKNNLAFTLLGIILGLVISTHFTTRQVACLFDSWNGPSYVCSDQYLERGDKVVIDLPGTEGTIYNNCEASYIAGQATNNGNKVWVLLKQCECSVFGNFVTQQFDLDYIKKASTK